MQVSSACPIHVWERFPLPLFRCAGTARLTTAEFVQFARKFLASYELPVRYLFVDRMPHTLSLKVNRSRLIKLFRESYPPE